MNFGLKFSALLGLLLLGGDGVRPIQYGATLPSWLKSWSRTISCPRASQLESDWDKTNQGDLNSWLARYGVTEVSASIDRRYLVQFAFEFSKFPENLRKELYEADGRIHLLSGQGVSEDPSWTGETKTFDGRPWSSVPGAGGFPYQSNDAHSYPTRVVVNHLYDEHGSMDLVLHEQAHTLDSIYSLKGISSSNAWKRVTGEGSGFPKFMMRYCGKYCADHADEGFAEAFALYYTCDSSRHAVEKNAPETAQFLHDLPTMDLLKLE
jgi:hypothetical protein